jgi:putative nucleotidyltransferase with HDIG domain
MTTNSYRVLIVDDELVVRKVLGQKLSAEGYQCQEATSADEALDKLRNNPFELVLSDIRMPGKSGVELLLEIRTAYPNTAVIMATAITDTSIAIECMKQGAYDYITKPFNLEEVVLNVSRALEKRRLELELRDYQHQLEQKVEEQSRKIRNSLLNAITTLVYALEAKDEYTSGHSQRVSETSVVIARALGMSEAMVEKIRVAGLLHDIGKIGVREKVLNKRSRLTEKEFEHIKRHSEIGEHILNPIVDDEEVLDMIRHHHEHYDGTGYPDHLSGREVSLGARILGLCDAYDAMTSELLPGAKILAISDAYDAMTSERPYRKAMSAEAACAEIARCKGTHFSPEVVDVFLRIKKAQSESPRIKKSRTRETAAKADTKD